MRVQMQCVILIYLQQIQMINFYDLRQNTQEVLSRYKDLFERLLDESNILNNLSYSSESSDVPQNQIIQLMQAQQPLNSLPTQKKSNNRIKKPFSSKIEPKQNDLESEYTEQKERKNKTIKKSFQKQKRRECLTKNMYQTIKNPFIRYLKQFFTEQEAFNQIYIIEKINKRKNKNLMTIEDFNDLFNEKLFEEHLERYFAQKRIYRDLMMTGISLQKKLEYQKCLHVFEEGFRNKRFQGLGSNSAQRGL